MLNAQTRDELKRYLFDSRMSGMFGDGLESDYIMDGCTIVGLNQMTDDELVEEYEQSCDGEDEFIARCKIELAIDKKLRE
jgi:hypothetical protein